MDVVVAKPNLGDPRGSQPPFSMSGKTDSFHLSYSDREEAVARDVNLLVVGPTSAAPGAAPTPPSVVLLKPSHFYLRSGFIQPVSFLLAFCKGCEPHPNSSGAVSVPCDYTL